MEGPTSSASSTTAARPTSSHKRNLSTLAAGTAKQAPSSSHQTLITLFLTNLRLLDLDLLPDWPHPTTSTLTTTGDARLRIRSVEFALYHLFRLYDPALTAEKLRPFFPPLEPLQSVNLRAALYRCFNEVKKNGGLGRDVVLRKTLLDECSGDKFWELCLGFSALVLKKVLLESKREVKPAAERLGAGERNGLDRREWILPLTIAHRSVLAKDLVEKQRKGETYARLYDVLVEKEAELVQRKVKMRETASTRPSAAQLDRLSGVEQTVRKSWIGHNELQEALVHGDDCRSSDSMLTQPFEELWKGAPSGAMPTDYAGDQGLLGGLQRTARDQTRRLRRWQSLHENMLAHRNSASSDQHQHDSQKSEQRGLNLNKHRSLSVRDAPVLAAESNRRPRPVSAISTYDTILTAMRDELRRDRSTSPHKQIQIHARKPSVHLDTTVGAYDPRSQLMHARSSSATAVPVRGPRSRGSGSESATRAYFPPKVISQRGLVPLKGAAGIFSPLKRGSMESSGSSPLGDIVGGEGIAEEIGEKVDSGVDNQLDRRGRNGLDNHDSETKNRAGSDDSSMFGSRSPSIGETAAAATSTPGVEGSPSAPSLVTAGGTPISPPMSSTSHPNRRMQTATAPRPSLAERTRMSMALPLRINSSEDVPTITSAPLLPSPAAISPDPRQHGLSNQSQSTSLDSDDEPTHTEDLLNRTRQSIAAHPTLDSNYTTANSNRYPAGGHARSRTSIVAPSYPVNQFSTPVSKKATRRSSFGGSNRGNEGLEVNGRDHGVSGRRDVTPREQLFSPEAEYDSVFKARPRIAVSP